MRRYLLLFSLGVATAAVPLAAESALRCPAGTAETMRVPCPPTTCPVPFPVCVESAVLSGTKAVPLPPPRCSFPKLPVYRSGGWSCVSP